MAINPATAAASIYREAAEAYDEVVDTRLVPIGAAYSGYDACFAFAGWSPAEVFGRIVARDLEEIGGVTA